MPRTQTLTSMLVVAYAVAGLTGCDGDNGVGPSSMPLVLEGTRAIPAFSIAVVLVPIDRQGELFALVDWNNFLNDMDSMLLRGNCTPTQVRDGAAGCRNEDALGFDRSFSRPAFFDARVTPGAHTLVVTNFGRTDDTFFYRLDLN